VAETIRRLRRAINPIVICLDGVGALGEVMRTEGVDVISMDRRPGFDFRLPFRMARVIRARRLQVLHAHQYTPFFYGALAAKLAGVGTRTVLTEHGRHFPDVVSAKRRMANRCVFDRLADRVTAVCAFSARGLSEQDGFDAGRIEVIENGIDVDAYRPSSDRDGLRQSLGLDTARRYIATIARFHPVKDHRTLLAAFARVAVAVPDVDLLLVGDGPLRSDLESLVRTLNLADRVRFFGVRRDIPAILGAIDLFALSSVSEAASITLLEAMASGKPVVVTDVGGNPEIVRGGVDGLLTPRGDATAMAAAMISLLKDPVLAARMGASGAARTADRYRLERTVERYQQLYSELAGSGIA
jgi:N-acetyl-alpha-D-glucosaminyl L-malate synthase BshA